MLFHSIRQGTRGRRSPIAPNGQPPPSPVSAVERPLRAVRRPTANGAGPSRRAWSLSLDRHPHVSGRIFSGRSRLFSELHAPRRAARARGRHAAQVWQAPAVPARSAVEVPLSAGRPARASAGCHIHGSSWLVCPQKPRRNPPGSRNFPPRRAPFSFRQSSVDFGLQSDKACSRPPASTSKLTPTLIPP